MLTLILAFLIQAPEPSLDERVDLFVKGDETVREVLVKSGSFAIRPLLMARNRAPELVNPLIVELKKGAAYPLPKTFDFRFKESRGGVGPFDADHAHMIGDGGIPFFVDPGSLIDTHFSKIAIKSRYMAFIDLTSGAPDLRQNIRNMDTVSSVLLAEEICKQTGLDFAWFHNHIIFGTPERLWPSGAPPTKFTSAELARIRMLLETLGSDSIELRDRAARDIIRIGSATLPVLEAHLSRSDTETAAQCRSIIAEIRRRARGIYGAPAILRQKLDVAGKAQLVRLEMTKLSIRFDHKPLGHILELLDKYHFAEAEIRGENGGKLVMLDLTDQSLLTLLSLVTQSLGLDFFIEGNRIVIDTREEIDRVLLRTR